MEQRLHLEVGQTVSGRGRYGVEHLAADGGRVLSEEELRRDAILSSTYGRG
jgi:hypothetical protein